MRKLLIAPAAALVLLLGMTPTTAQAAPPAAPVISAENGIITWPAVPNADSYNVDLDGQYFTTVPGPPYTAPKSGSYAVIAVDKDPAGDQFSPKSNTVDVVVAETTPTPTPTTTPTTTPPDEDWTTVFRDDFDGDTVSENFYVPEWTSGNRFAVNNVDACSQGDGTVDLSVKKVGEEHHACYLISNETYGPGDDSTLRISYTADVTQLRAKGAWAAGWMYPLGTADDGTHYSSDGDASTGSEYDVFEYSPAWATAFNSAVHDGRPTQTQQWTDNKGIETGMHTWTLQWNKECQVFSVDGDPVWKITDPNLISQKDNHHIMLTMEAVTGRDLLTWQEIGDFAENLTNFPATTKFDSVSVEKKSSIDSELCGDDTIPSPEPTTTASPEPSVTPTASPDPTASSNPTVTVTETASPNPTVTVTEAPVVDPYSTPGYHRVNERIWFTTCEPYSQTTRCRTNIWSTVVKVQANGRFSSQTGWHFNNLTYLPEMTRAKWGSNPLANAGDFVSEGRKWRTECDTAATGRNGCRSFIWVSDVVESTRTASGSYRYSTVDKWVFNNIIRFR